MHEIKAKRRALGEEMEQYSTSLYEGNAENTNKQMVNADLKVQHSLAETVVGYEARMDVGVRRRMLKCIEELDNTTRWFRASSNGLHESALSTCSSDG